MKLYLAARYSRNADMRVVRDLLLTSGHEVTSRWIDQHGGDLPDSLTPEELARNPARGAKYAEIDLEDIRAADAVISFTSAGAGKGGRHAEFGYAAGLGKHLVIVGPREHVFHTLTGTEWYPDQASFLVVWAFGGEGLHPWLTGQEG